MTSFRILFNGTDVSGDLNTLSDQGSLALASGQDLIVGLEKKFYSFFLYLSGVTGSANLAVHYWNGSGWTIFPARKIRERTKGAIKSGIVDFDPVSDWLVKDGFYDLKLVFGPNVTVKTLTVLFAWDVDLVAEFAPIMEDQYRLGQSDYALVHQSVRDEIVQHFRNRGFTQTGVSKTLRSGLNWYENDNLTFFDLLNIDEIRIAAVQLALHKIFNVLSDTGDKDRWGRLASYYYGKYEKAIDLAYVTFQRDTAGSMPERLTESRLVR